ncbi:MAG: glutamine synthetase [Elusimicrobia bacterium CG08_land_8_20_14_0_20_51_18]|nr:MAG: glutamine synthetase [Elusimicrobia bacterium CG08_land_8_20_14_0_20_51_18]
MNLIEKALNKDARSFTREDLLKFAKANGVEIFNFRYVAGDGRLKTLNFTVNDPKYLDKILSCGERADGSSLFRSIDASSSDLYVVPRYSSVFINPFSQIPAMDVICGFYDKDGNPFASSPDNILKKADKRFRDSAGLEMKALGELEYYVISPKNALYPAIAQKGYHESAPFNKWEFLRVEAANLIDRCGGHIKYAHSEVGFIRTEEQEMSQHEIEFLPQPLLKSAEEIVVSRWILSSLGYKYGVVITFAPKISVGHAGSGFHIHACLAKNGKNVMLKNKNLSDEAKKVIAGWLKSARSLTAFGNTVPTSYLRLVPHQEAPINVCWGYRNRSALVRVPLGWNLEKDMVADMNPQVKKRTGYEGNQTVEFRSADGSANIYLLLSGLVMAAAHGFEMKDSVNYAEEHFIDRNVFRKENLEIREKFPSLPASCAESADELLKDREVYEKGGVFPQPVIDGLVKRLRSYGDKNLSEKLYGKEEDIKKIVEEYLYC